MDVSTLVERLGRTPSATARKSGLSRMTVQRVRDGVSSPSLGTLRELALAAGYDVDVSLVAASDPGAAVAARMLLDPAFDTSIELSAEVAEWVERLERYELADPRKMLALAGTLSAPQHRKGARHFRPKTGLTQQQTISIAASAAQHSAGLSALSGVPAAIAYVGEAPDPGTILIWASGLDVVDAVSERLGSTFAEADQFQPAGIIVAPTLDGYFVDLLDPSVSGVTIVAPIQAAIDLHGLGYAELADAITEGW